MDDQTASYTNRMQDAGDSQAPAGKECLSGVGCKSSEPQRLLYNTPHRPHLNPYCATSITVIVVIVLVLKLGNLLLSLSTDVLYIIPVVFKFIIKLITVAVISGAIILVAHCL